jgi:hypothetical protein
MPLTVCADASGLFDVGDACTRRAWATLCPALLVVLFLLAGSPLRVALGKLLPRAYWLFPFITPEEARHLLFRADNYVSVPKDAPKNKTRWRAIVIVGISLGEALGWAIAGIHHLLPSSPDAAPMLIGRPFVVGATWIYAAARPAFTPKPTPYYDLILLFVAQLGGRSLVLGGDLFAYQVGKLPLPKGLPLAAQVLDLLALTVLLGVTLSTPLSVAAPTTATADENTSPEEITTVWGWLYFGWMVPLIHKGTSQALSEKDVWDLTPVMRSRPLFAKFGEVKGASLLFRIWKASAFDLTLEFFLGTPFFSHLFPILFYFFPNQSTPKMSSASPWPTSRPSSSTASSPPSPTARPSSARGRTCTPR